MEEFELKGYGGSIKLVIKEVPDFPHSTSPFGGYDASCSVKIKSPNYEVNDLIWITTNDIYEFCHQVQICQEQLCGEAIFDSYEKNLKMQVVYDERGHCIIKGGLERNGEDTYRLIFELTSDQTYINASLKQMQAFVQKYGGATGIEH
jgi:hypothetical protein